MHPVGVNVMAGASSGKFAFAVMGMMSQGVALSQGEEYCQ